MKSEVFALLEGSDATLTTYILDNEEYGRKDTVKPAMLVCPGGGYTEVSRNEGEPVALAFAAEGYHAFVLKYSVKIEHPFPQALMELAAAMKLIRSRAKEWLIDPEHISVAGFSAGGHLAASLGECYSEPFLTEALRCSAEDIKPNSLVLGYPAFSLNPVREGEEMPQYLIDLIEQGLMMDFRGPNIRQILTGKLDYTEAELERVNLLKHVSSKMPPLFIFGCFADMVIPVNDWLAMANLCKEKNVPCELHIYANGCHGQGLYKKHCSDENAWAGNHMDKWFENALLWLEEIK